MELKDVKVGQRVFVKRESTAKLDEIEEFGMKLVKTLNKAIGFDIVEECKKQNGFYVVEIKDNGNICLGSKDDAGTLQYGWGVYDASDLEAVDKEETNKPSSIYLVLKDILETLKQIERKIKPRSIVKEKPSGVKRGRGRPKGSLNKKYKGGIK